jgi:hypothetical protein
VSAEVHLTPSFSIGQQRVLFSAVQYLQLGFIQSYDVTPDDRRFVMMREGAPSEQSELILTENWFQELKARTRR